MMVIWLIFEKGTFYHLIQGSVTNLQNTPEFAYVLFSISSLEVADHKDLFMTLRGLEEVPCC